MSATHDHNHGEAAGWVLWFAVALTLAFAGVEAGVGWWAGSLALVADAGHMVNDAGALVIAAVAGWIARRPASRLHSYGLGRAEFIAALVNSLGLLALVVWLSVSAVTRLQAPQPVQGEAVSLTAALGLAINIGVAWLLSRGAQNLNTRAAMLHVIGDLLGSVAALIAGVVITFTGWTPIDPLLSMAIGALILVSSLRLLRQALHGLMEGVPLHLSLEEIGLALAGVPGVKSVHDLHVWSVASDEIMISAHLLVEDMHQWQSILEASRTLLHDRFDIGHVTLQPEADIHVLHLLPIPKPAGETPHGHDHA
ncbi:cation diffusion facilitator family transporter (plasmid) [Sulfuricella denitrificans skB26]|uniref:Cation diffusion facilitator family transporter n=1 Tax=Sulfuricella denitrificans (strain DSM 22764 / NBRC 105220 / skB26) TaxID=1163617 RepID=S6B984_SULDS|nr:cation diffusion facilitator family transporter [Sulfuricella denitrificans]BAN36882.1 cation diffusion facilitator family transporter [Sulfuricella denitrificans skB26]